MTSSRHTAERAWHASLQGLVFALTGFICSYTVADPDLWGHVRFGLDTLGAGSLVHTDPYSYLSAGSHWINHEWLAEVAMALAWDQFGAPGLVALKVAVVWATVAIVMGHLRRRGLSLLATALVVIGGWWLMLPWLTALRPQMFTYLGSAAILALVARAEDGDLAALWWAVPVMAAWANLHGGFLAGLGLFAAWAATHVVANAWSRGWTHPATRRALVGCGASLLAAAAATLLNPYGAQLWVFLRTALGPRTEIAEWNPVALLSIEGVAHLAILVPALVGWLWSRRPKPLALSLVFFGATLAPFAARRHTPIFALAAMMLAAEHLADVASRLAGGDSAPAPDPPVDGRRRWLLTTPVALAAAIFTVASVPHFAGVLVRPWELPIAPVRWLAATRVEGEMVTFFDWGEYVIWHLAPRIRVSMDGRRETVYSDSVYHDDERLLFGVGRWDALLARGTPALVLMNRGFAADNLLRLTPAWRVAYEDERCTLFVRRGTPQDARLRAGTPPAPVPDEPVLTFP